MNRSGSLRWALESSIPVSAQREETHQPVHQERRPQHTEQRERCTSPRGSDKRDFHYPFLVWFSQENLRTGSTSRASSGLTCLVRIMRRSDCDAFLKRSRMNEKRWDQFLLFGVVKVHFFQRNCLWRKNEIKKDRKKAKGGAEKGKKKKLWHTHGREEDFPNRYPIKNRYPCSFLRYSAVRKKSQGDIHIF